MNLREYRRVIHDGRINRTEEFKQLFRAAGTSEFAAVWSGPSMVAAADDWSDLGMPARTTVTGGMGVLKGPDYLTWLLIRHGMHTNGGSWDGKCASGAGQIDRLCCQAVLYAVAVLTHEGVEGNSREAEFRRDPHSTVVQLAAGYHTHLVLNYGDDWGINGAIEKAARVRGPAYEMREWLDGTGSTWLKGGNSMALLSRTWVGFDAGGWR